MTSCKCVAQSQRLLQVLGTMFTLIPLLSSFLLVLFLVYYGFAIIGISLFAGKVTPV